MLMCMCFIYIRNLEKYLLIDYDSLRQKPLDLHLVKQYPLADKPVQDYNSLGLIALLADTLLKQSAKTSN